jgi:hypothetical protein
VAPMVVASRYSKNFATFQKRSSTTESMIIRVRGEHLEGCWRRTVLQARGGRCHSIFDSGIRRRGSAI